MSGKSMVSIGVTPMLLAIENWMLKYGFAVQKWDHDTTRFAKSDVVDGGNGNTMTAIDFRSWCISVRVIGDELWVGGAHQMHRRIAKLADPDLFDKLNDRVE